MLARLATLGLLSTMAFGAVIDERASLEERANSVDLITCKKLETALSEASLVSYPGSATYADDIHHYVPSSVEQSACSVQPGSAQDVSTILKTLATTTTKFAIKTGGHGTDQGVSSTTGIQIALSRLNSVVYDKAAQTVTFGAGQKWSDLYPQLEKYGVMVAGGRIVGVGVGGFILGGGYSWLTNERGLGVDNVLAFEVVLPTGEITTATATQNKDLFWALKGGFNNFGILTKVTMIAYPQGQIYGGGIVYDAKYLPKVVDALSVFQATNKDPKGNTVGVYNVDQDGTQNVVVALYYQDATKAPKDFFKAFTDVPYTLLDLKARSFFDFINGSSPILENPKALRGEFQSINLPILDTKSMTIMTDAIKKYSVLGNSTFAPKSKITITLEPFLASGVVNKDLNSASFYHDFYASPTNIFFAWEEESQDLAGGLAIRAIGSEIRAKLQAESSNLSEDIPLYGNYALYDVSVKSMYGPNYARLVQLRAKYDPHNLMLRAGGYKFL